MREYLFRGKRCDNGEWIEGSLIIYDWDNRYISIYSTEEEMAFRVDPETVGQYTGLTDNNEKKIFEGDIVRYTNELEEINAPEIGVVVYEKSECHFEVQREIKNHCNVCIPKSINVAYLFDDVRCSYEVIGNIYDYDNPELLEDVEA